MGPTRRGPLDPGETDLTLLRLLGQSPLFGTLSTESRRSLCEKMRQRAIAPGETVTVEGEEADSLFLVAQGTFVVHVAGEQVGSLGPGDHFGEMSWVFEMPRTATVSAPEGGLVWLISTRTLEALADDIPVFRAAAAYEAQRRYSVDFGGTEST